MVGCVKKKIIWFILYETPIQLFNSTTIEYFKDLEFFMYSLKKKSEFRCITNAAQSA